MNLDHRHIIGPAVPQAEPYVIGQPILFTSGQFSGQTIRVELQELQKAESGRKYAKVDRRPLDPPPAIVLRLYVVHDAGTATQWEQEVVYDNVLNVGIVCTVDLFPIPNSALEDVHTSPSSSTLSTSAHAQGNQRPDGGDVRAPLTYYPVHPFSSLDAEGRHPYAKMPPFQIPRRHPLLCELHGNERPRDVVHQQGQHLVTESSKVTPALVGEKFAEPTLVDYRGERMLMFVFADLAVQREGHFIFRYRAFDIYSTTRGSAHHPVLTETFGGAFRVYSTREFPGLEPSTDLTKTLASYGVRVVLRDADRKSRRRERERRGVGEGTDAPGQGAEARG